MKQKYVLTRDEIDRLHETIKQAHEILFNAELIQLNRFYNDPFFKGQKKCPPGSFFRWKSKRGTHPCLHNLNESLNILRGAMSPTHHRNVLDVQGSLDQARHNMKQPE